MPVPYQFDSASGAYHFKLPNGGTFSLRKPKLSDLKRAAQLAGAKGGSLYDELALSEQFALLLLTRVNGQSMSYEEAVSAGGLEGIFPELEDCREVMRIAQELTGGGQAVPLESPPPRS